MDTARPQSVAFVIRGPITRADLADLCERVCALLGETGVEVAFCDVAGIGRDAVTVDALARLQLAARRHGCQVRLRHASHELLDLVNFMGLRDVCPADRPAGKESGRALVQWLGVEPWGQAEEREDGFRAEEERQLDDPAV